MGLNGYYKHFIKGFSKITCHFTALNRKNTFFKWSVAWEGSFQELKQRLVTTLIDVDDTHGVGWFCGIQRCFEEGLGGVCSLAKREGNSKCLTATERTMNKTIPHMTWS